MTGRARNRAHTLFRNLRWMDTHHFNTIFRIAKTISRLLADESGATAIEYGLIAGHHCDH